MKSYKEIYLAELVFNLSRFVEESCISKPSSMITEIPENCFLSQSIIGDYKALTAMYGSDEALIQFAANYSKIEVDKFDSLCNELLGDFLNLHNGLFVVNLSDTQDVESSLEVPVIEKPAKPISLRSHTYVMPIEFKFGTVNFVLSE